MNSNTGKCFALAVSFVVAMVCRSQYVCHDVESCIFESISYSGTGNIECYGYRSCEQSPKIIATSASYIECHGSYSCYESNYVSLNGSSALGIDCNGLLACGKIAEMYVNQGYIHCWAEQSCIESKMTAIGSYPIYCSGDRSCQASTIYTQYNVFFVGHLSGLNSIIYSDSSTINVYFNGAFSGYNSTVICGIDDTCNVYCYGNACNNLNGIYCIDYNNSNCIINKYEYSYDNYRIPSDIISSIVNDSDDYLLPMLVNFTISTYDNSYYPCYTANTNAINCDSYQECDYNNNSLLISDNAPICCTAANSCYHSLNNISVTIPSNNNLIGNTAIRCDGKYSCYDASIIYGINGNIYLTSLDAANGLNINGIIKTGNKNLYDIYCTGFGSCKDTYIYNCNNLYCNGDDSCRFSGKISNINNIYGYGAYSIYQVSKIEYINNIYCGGIVSCYQTDIENVYDSVYASSYQSLKSSSIGNVKNNVIIAGYQTAAFATIYNATNIYCIGVQSCYQLNARGIHNKIYINGNNAISGSSVIISETNFDENGTLFVYINGTNDDGTFDIYCNDTDICKIACLSNDACTQLSVHCNNNCFVDCDASNGIDCPYDGTWEEWVTSNPTNMPSIYPSNIPSIEPSSMPSVEPSNIPSSNPSSIPSIEPSSIPSIIPSSIPSNEPSMFPSFKPTVYPSGYPVMIPTVLPSDEPSQNPFIIISSDVPTTSISSSLYPTAAGNSGTNDSSETDSSSSATMSASDIIIIVAIVTVGLLLCLGMILLYAHFNHKKKDNNNNNNFNNNNNTNYNNINYNNNNNGSQETRTIGNINKNERILNEIEMDKVTSTSNVLGSESPNEQNTIDYINYDENDGKFINETNNGSKKINKMNTDATDLNDELYQIEGNNYDDNNITGGNTQAGNDSDSHDDVHIVDGMAHDDNDTNAHHD